jgi:tetratricopeptide (TPR) repeat protein
MFLLQHQNDSAAHYLELRASLDTTNVEWQMDAGKFIEEYLADVDAASEYYHRSLRQALPINNGLNNDVAKVFDAMTKICKKKGQYNEMMQYSQKSLVVRKSLFGEKDPSIATSYLNIANSNCDLGNHDLALKQFDTVLNIVTYANSDVSDLEAKAYYGMGKVYNYYKNNLEKALWCYEMQKKSLLKNTKENEPRMIKCYDRLSELYMHLGEFDKSMEYNKKAMGIVMEHYGDNHPETADLIGSRGKCHLFKGELKEALDDLNQSYDKLRFFYGDDNAKVADALGLIAYVYFSSGDFDAAVKKEMMVLKTHLKTLGEKHKATAYDYLFLASCYESMNDFDKALEYAEKSLEIYKQTLGEENEEAQAAKGTIEEIEEKRRESGWRDNG